MAIRGELGILSVWDGAAYRPTACITSNGMSSQMSVIETSTKCNPGVVSKTPGVFSYSLTGDGEYIDTTSIGGETTKASHDWLLSKQMDADTAMVDWKYDTGAPNSIYYGSAIITSLQLTQASGTAVSTFTFTLDGNGGIATVDPHA